MTGMEYNRARDAPHCKGHLSVILPTPQEMEINIRHPDGKLIVTESSAETGLVCDPPFSGLAAGSCTLATQLVTAAKLSPCLGSASGTGVCLLPFSMVGVTATGQEAEALCLC